MMTCNQQSFQPLDMKLKDSALVWLRFMFMLLFVITFSAINHRSEATQTSTAEAKLARLFFLTDSLTENAAYMAAESVATVGLDLARATFPPHSCR